MQFLKTRLPTFNALLPVFAVISFLVYGWTVTIFFWKLPSWVMFLTLGEILVNFAYAMTACLLESLAILTLLILVSAILPASMMKDVFAARGTTAALTALAFIMFYMYRFSKVGYSFLDQLIPWSAWGFALTIFLTFLAARFRIIVRLAAWTSDRVTVFLYLFLPVSLVSLLVVIYRNLF